MNEGLIFSLLLGVIMFAVAVMAFWRGLIHWKRGGGIKDKVLMMVMFVVSAFATVSFWTWVIDLSSG
ncbi:MAG: hypothetical protein QGI35_04775 [Arenicellales bacterium]|nr:hypothetical protein [Arenicellales bacterium]|tara:strand:- start:1011 stop:1211 length:201 start_codon:yes stop_codon:yes gene_type:complete